MNSKGIYSAVLGLVAIILVSIIVINANTSVQDGTAMDYGNEIVELKFKMQNLREVLDRAASDVFCEATKNNDCEALGDYHSKIMLIFRNLVDKFNSKETLIKCGIRPLTSITEGDDFSIKIVCVESIKKDGETEFEIVYNKVFIFNKSVVSVQINPEGECEAVTVRDGYSSKEVTC